MKKLIKIIILNTIGLSIQGSDHTTEQHLNFGDYKEHLQTSPLLTQRVAVNYGACVIAPQILESAQILPLIRRRLSQSEEISINKMNLLEIAIEAADNRSQELCWFDCFNHCILAYNLRKASIEAIDDDYDDHRMFHESGWISKNHCHNINRFALALDLHAGIPMWSECIPRLSGYPWIPSDTALTLACCSVISAMPYRVYEYGQNTKSVATNQLRQKQYYLSWLLNDPVDIH